MSVPFKIILNRQAKHFYRWNLITTFKDGTLQMEPWPKDLTLLSFKSLFHWQLLLGFRLRWRYGLIRIALWSLEPTGGSWEHVYARAFTLTKHQSKIEFCLVGTLIICVSPEIRFRCLSLNPVLVGLKSPVTMTTASGWRQRKESTLDWIWLYNSEYSTAPDDVVR
jgi:hypothetical protein